MSTFLAYFHTLSIIQENEGFIDDGGPSRQFLVDVFKQIKELSVKVGNDWVKLFETAHSGEIVVIVTDEVLEYNIARAGLKSGTDQESMKTAAVKQAKDYIHILLHAMANNHQFCLQ